MPKRQKEIQVQPMTEEDLKYWAEQLFIVDPDEDKNRTKQLAYRVVNLADLSSMVDYIVRVHNQQMNQVLLKQAKDLGVLKQIVINELDIPDDKLEEYEEDFTNKLTLDMQVEERIQELKAEGKEVTYEDVEEIYEELSEEDSGE